MLKALAPSLLALTLVAAAASAPALESPLVLRPTGAGYSNNGVTLTINPSSGVITYYNTTTQSTELVASASFAFDLELKDKAIYTEQKGDPFSWLRLGDPDWKLNPQSLMGKLPNRKPAPDKPSPLEAAMTAETNFWAKEPEYDGVVRAAWNGSYAALCLPSKHAILFYDTSTGQTIKLAHWVNYGPLLLLPTGYSTNPTPQEVYRNLPKLQQDQLEAEAKKAEDDAGDAPKETPRSDVWIAAAQGDTFVVYDIPNSRIMTFQITGKQATIIAVRNISYELKLPARQNWHSTPDEGDALTKYASTHKKDIEAAGLAWLLSDQKMMTYNLRALVAAHAAKARGGGAQNSTLQASSLDDKIVLDFTDKHKLVTYSLTANSLDLVSVRDYTIDLAIAALDEMINEKKGAHELLAMAEKSTKTKTTAMRLLKFCLKLDPTLVDAAEKSTRLVGDIGKEADWGPTMDQAHKDKDDLTQKMQGIKDAAQKMKDDDDKLLNPPKEPQAPK
jgi:hypothetical protein